MRSRIRIALGVATACLLLGSPASAGGKSRPEAEWSAVAGDMGGIAFSRAVAAAGDEASVMVGGFSGSAVFGRGEPNETTLTSLSPFEDAFVAAYDDDGGLRWAISVEATIYVDPFDVDVGRDGRICVAGYFEGDATFGAGGPSPVTLSTAMGDVDAFLACYEADGSLAWAVPIGSPGFELAYTVAARRDGTVVVGGTFTEDLPLDVAPFTLAATGDYEGFLIAYDADGAQLWARGTEGTPGSTAEFSALDAYADGDLAVGGAFSGSVTFAFGEDEETTETSAGDRDGFACRLAASGDTEWTRVFGGTDEDLVNGVGATKDQGLWVGGSFRLEGVFTGGGKTQALLSAGSTDGFLALFDKRGKLREAERIGGPEPDAVEELVALNDNGAAVVGFFAGEALFAADAKKPVSLSTSGPLDQDLFVARYKKNGKLDWAVGIGGAGYDGSGGLAAPEEHELVVGGFFEGSADVRTPSPLPLSGTGLFDAVLVGLED